MTRNKDSDSTEDEDVLLMGPDLGDDSRPFYRKNSEGLHAGLMRPVKEGQPIPEDAFQVEHKGPGPVYKVTPVFDKNSHSRPATAAYKKGWDRIFGGKSVVGQA